MNRRNRSSIIIESGPKKNSKKDRAAECLTRCISPMYGLMMSGILGICVFLSGMDYACKSFCLIFLPAALLIAAGMIFICGLFSICGSRCIYRWGKVYAEKKYVWFPVFAILSLMQIYFVWNYYFFTDWDVGYINALSDAAAHNLDVSPFSTYFSMYPNNLLLVFIFTWIKKFVHFIGIHEQEYFAVLCVNCLINTFTGLLLAKVLMELFDNISLSVLGYFLYVFLIGFSPWVSIPYSDSVGLLFPIWIIDVYINRNKKKRTYVSWFAISVLAVLGYKIKPQIFIVFISIVLLGCIHVIKTGINKILIKKSAAIVAGVACTLIISHMATVSLHVDIDKEKTYGLSHFFAMGMNSEEMGIWSGEDVAFSSEFETVEARDAANINKALGRIKEMGVAGTLKQLVRKTLTNYYSGTFSWGVEGMFFSEIFEERNSPICKLARGLYYQRSAADIGIYSSVWSNFEQMIWLTVLFLSIFSAFSSQCQERNVIMLAIIGLTIFELIFEARARYLYIYAPLYIILSVYGIDCLRKCFTRSGGEGRK